MGRFNKQQSSSTSLASDSACPTGRSPGRGTQAIQTWDCRQGKPHTLGGQGVKRPFWGGRGSISSGRAQSPAHRPGSDRRRRAQIPPPASPLASPSHRRRVQEELVQPLLQRHHRAEDHRLNTLRGREGGSRDTRGNGQQVVSPVSAEDRRLSALHRTYGAAAGLDRGSWQSIFFA